MYGGVRGRGLAAPSYSIGLQMRAARGIFYSVNMPILLSPSVPPPGRPEKLAESCHLQEPAPHRSWGQAVSAPS